MIMLLPIFPLPHFAGVIVAPVYTNLSTLLLVFIKCLVIVIFLSALILIPTLSAAFYLLFANLQCAYLPDDRATSSAKSRYSNVDVNFYPCNHFHSI